jgi:hypothetical protein
MEFGMAFSLDVVRNGPHYNALDGKGEVAVSGDGDCFYRAVSRSIFMQNNTEQLTSKQQELEGAGDNLQAEYLGKIIKARDQNKMTFELESELASDLRNMASLEYLYHSDKYESEGGEGKIGFARMMVRGKWETDLPMPILTKVLKSSYEIHQIDKSGKKTNFPHNYEDEGSLITKKRLPPCFDGVEPSNLNILKSKLDLHKEEILGLSDGDFSTHKAIIVDALESFSRNIDDQVASEIDQDVAHKLAVSDHSDQIDIPDESPSLIQCWAEDIKATEFNAIDEYKDRMVKLKKDIQDEGAKISKKFGKSNVNIDDIKNIMSLIDMACYLNDNNFMAVCPLTDAQHMAEKAPEVYSATN